MSASVHPAVEPDNSVTEELLPCLLTLRSGIGTQPKRDVCWLHRLRNHPHQVAAHGIRVRLVPWRCREGFEGLSGLFDPFTTERVYFYVYVRYESWFNQCPYPPFPFPTYYPDTGTGSDYLKPYSCRTPCTTPL